MCARASMSRSAARPYSSCAATGWPASAITADVREPSPEPARLMRMRQVDDHYELSADEARQSGQGLSAQGVWAFALAMVVLAASAFILISLYAQHHS